MVVRKSLQPSRRTLQNRRWKQRNEQDYKLTYNGLLNLTLTNPHERYKQLRPLTSHKQPPIWTSAHTIIVSRLNPDEEINSTRDIVSAYSTPPSSRILHVELPYPSQSPTTGFPASLTPAKNALTSFISFCSQFPCRHTIRFAGPTPRRDGGRFQPFLRSGRISAPLSAPSRASPSALDGN